MGVAGFDDVGDAHEDACSFSGDHAGPGALVECFFRCGDGAVYVGFGACGGVEVGGVGDGVEYFEGVAVEGVTCLTVDVVLGFGGHGVFLHIVGRGLGCGWGVLGVGGGFGFVLGAPVGVHGE